MDLLLIATAVLVVAIVVWWAIRRGGSQANATLPAMLAVAVPAGRGLRTRLNKTRKALAGGLAALSERRVLDDEYWSEMEDLLVAADVGVPSASALVAVVRDSSPTTFGEARSRLQQELAGLFADRERALVLAGAPAVVLVVGVNGGGKTTSIAKLAAALKQAGRSVLLGAADTYRAAGDQQLQMWADRVAVDVITGHTGADPASVAFDSYRAACARGADVLIIDTAGRLQNKMNLMAELNRVARVLRRESGRIDEVLLVVDGSTGQNALSQVRTFTEAASVTGIVITKLDGTARGGVAVAIERELGIPVKYIGVGEGLDDLVPFDPDVFVDALLGP